jgi:hypothetical protein
MPASQHHRFQRRAPPAVALAFGLLAGCAREPEPEPVFCYRTLADIACYDRPDPGREGQLVGIYLQDPDDPSRKAYWLRHVTAPMSR